MRTSRCYGHEFISADALLPKRVKRIKRRFERVLKRRERRIERRFEKNQLDLWYETAEREGRLDEEELARLDGKYGDDWDIDGEENGAYDDGYCSDVYYDSADDYYYESTEVFSHETTGPYRLLLLRRI